MNQKRRISLPAGYKAARLGMIVTSFQDLKLCGKQISQSFSNGELTNSPPKEMVQKCTVYKKIRKCRSSCQLLTKKSQMLPPAGISFERFEFHPLCVWVSKKTICASVSSFRFSKLGTLETP